MEKIAAAQDAEWQSNRAAAYAPEKDSFKARIQRAAAKAKAKSADDRSRSVPSEEITERSNQVRRADEGEIAGGDSDRRRLDLRN